MKKSKKILTATLLSIVAVGSVLPTVLHNNTMIESRANSGDIFDSAGWVEQTIGFHVSFLTINKRERNGKKLLITSRMSDYSLRSAIFDNEIIYDLDSSSPSKYHYLFNNEAGEAGSTSRMLYGNKDRHVDAVGFDRESTKMYVKNISEGNNQLKLITSFSFGNDDTTMRKEEVLTITENGGILHNLRFTNIGKTPIVFDEDNQINILYDTQLNRDDSIPIYSGGNGEVYMQNKDFRLAAKGVHNVKKIAAGVYDRFSTHVDVNDIHKDNIVANDIDTGISYTSNFQTLQPGESAVMSFMENAYSIKEVMSQKIKLKYVDSDSRSIKTSDVNLVEGVNLERLIEKNFKKDDKNYKIKENFVLPKITPEITEVEIPMEEIIDAFNTVLKYVEKDNEINVLKTANVKVKKNQKANIEQALTKDNKSYHIDATFSNPNITTKDQEVVIPMIRDGFDVNVTYIDKNTKEELETSKVNIANGQKVNAKQTLTKNNKSYHIDPTFTAKIINSDNMTETVPMIRDGFDVNVTYIDKDTKEELETSKVNIANGQKVNAKQTLTKDNVNYTLDPSFNAKIINADGLSEVIPMLRQDFDVDIKYIDKDTKQVLKMDKQRVKRNTSITFEKEFLHKGQEYKVDETFVPKAINRQNETIEVPMIEQAINLHVNYKLLDKTLFEETLKIKRGEELDLNPSKFNKDGKTYKIKENFVIPIVHSNNLVIDVPLTETIKAMSIKPIAITRYHAYITYKDGQKVVKAVPVLIEKDQIPTVSDFEHEKTFYKIDKNFVAPKITINHQVVEVPVNTATSIDKKDGLYAHIVYKTKDDKKLYEEIALVKNGEKPLISLSKINDKLKYKIADGHEVPEVIIDRQLIEILVEPIEDDALVTTTTTKINYEKEKSAEQQITTTKVNVDKMLKENENKPEIVEFIENNRIVKNEVTNTENNHAVKGEVTNIEVITKSDKNQKKTDQVDVKSKPSNKKKLVKTNIAGPSILTTIISAIGGFFVNKKRKQK